MKKQQKTQKGSASIYSVVVLMLFASITVVGFVRLMVPLLKQTNNYNLSEAAYDAAMSGVEDAKIALAKLDACRGQNTPDCNKIRNSFNDPKCDMLSEILENRTSDADGGIQVGSTAIGGNSIDESYLCVKIEANSNYAGTLSANNSSRLIPIRTTDDSIFRNIGKIEVTWIWEKNDKPVQALNESITSNTRFAHLSSSDHVPALHIDLASKGRIIYSDTIQSETYIPRDSDQPINPPDAYSYKAALCTKLLTQYKCSATIPIDSLVSSNMDPNNTFVRVSLFGHESNTAVDYEVTLKKLSGDGSEEVIPFYGVQAKVDSTGRAGSMLRRVEARIDYADVNYPFLNYALGVLDAGDDPDATYFSVNKSYYATNGCETQNPSAEAKSENALNYYTHLEWSNTGEIECANMGKK